MPGYNKIIGNLNLDKQTYKYTWDFSYFDLSFSQAGKKFSSPRFGTTFHDKVFHWQIWLYPRGLLGVSNDREMSIGIFNYSSNTVIADVSFGFVNKENKVVNIKFTDRKTYNTKRTSEATWMIKDFAEQDFLSEDNKVIHDFGKVKIECEINVYGNDERERKKLDDIENEQELTLQFQEFRKYECLMNEDEYSDISFMIENKRLNAHKCILSKSSPVFAAMFRHEMKEKLENTVIVGDIQYDVFKEMIRFVYVGKINFELDDVESISNLLIAADKYSIDGLKIKCIKLIYNNLTIDNAVGLLIFSDLHQVDYLKIKAMQLIVLHSYELEKVPDFKDLIKKPNILYEVCHAIGGKERFPSEF